MALAEAFNLAASTALLPLSELRHLITAAPKPLGDGARAMALVGAFARIRMRRCKIDIAEYRGNTTFGNVALKSSWA